MKTLFLLLGVVVCVTYATELADLASDQYEARIIEEWSACSQFCVDNCKARYGVEQYSLCFEYACGCKVLTQEPEATTEEEEADITPEETAEMSEEDVEISAATVAAEAGVFPGTAGTEIEVSSYGSMILLLCVGAIMLWIIRIIAWNSI